MTLFSLMLAVVACSQDAIPTAPSGPEQNRLVASVRITPGDLLLAPDDARVITATVSSARGQIVNGRVIHWSTSDASVASINTNGHLVAGREGSATITANVEGVVGTARVDVQGDVVAIEFDTPDQSMREGQNQQLLATYIYSNGARRPVGRVAWTSSDEAIGIVDGGGLVTAVGTGAVNIEARGRKRRGTLTVDVASETADDIAISRSGVVLQVGQTVELWANVSSADGKRLKRQISWSTSDAAIAAVDQSGRVTGRSVGQSTITARSGNLTASATVDVQTSSTGGGSGSSGGSASGPSSPGAVTDLAVVGSDDSSITLQFSQVDDGTGSPARYEIRHKQGATGSPWGQGVVVQRGTCSAPLQGTSTVATITCVVDGLHAQMDYAFQLAAFRTNGGSEVFGPLSNSASGSTRAPGVVVSVVPSAFALDVGASRSVTASVTDVYGNPLGHPVTWTSSRSSVAQVNASGSVNGVSAGQAGVRASAGGASAVADVTVQSQQSPTSGGGSSASTSRANEPAGFTRITETSFNSITEDGWEVASARNSSIQQTTSAPASPDNVLRQMWPSGSTGGDSEGNWIARRIPQGGQEVYVSFWIQHSGNWLGHSSGTNKMLYLEVPNAPGYPVFLNAYGIGSGTTLRPAVFLQNQDNRPCGFFNPASNLFPNRDTSKRLVKGTWHHIEFYAKLNTRASGVTCDGVARMWVDGNLVVDHSKISYLRPDTPASSWHWGYINMNPVWGGSTPDVNGSAMWKLIDHFYASGR